MLEHQALVGQTSLSADWTEVPRKGSGSWACKVGGSSQTSALSATLGVERCLVTIRYTWTRSGPTLPSKPES